MLRDRFLWWVLSVGGVPEGCEPPWWGRAMQWVLFPLRCWHWHVENQTYDWASDCFIVDGVRVSRQWLWRMVNGPFPTPWMRAVSRTKTAWGEDMVCMETRADDPETATRMYTASCGFARKEGE